VERSGPICRGLDRCRGGRRGLSSETRPVGRWLEKQSTALSSRELLGQKAPRPVVGLRSAQVTSQIIYGVFVSSTYEDLREERAEVQKALLKLRCFPIGMELFGSADDETWEFIKRQIDGCDYYVVVIADRYGSIADDGLSFTEKEYDYARLIGKPTLAFLHGARDTIQRSKVEADPEKRLKLEAFIQKVKRSPLSYFSNAPTTLRHR
jgi:Domain of unknown function (DUF4062)